MPSISERSTPDQIRTYDRARSVVFLKTHEAFGGLSNMAGGFPLHVQGTRIYTSEALYQACRFPHLPEVQRLIIGQASPMTAKMKSKPHRKNSRADWDRVRVRVMRWCLRVKLAQNWDKFSELLLGTGDRPIVEESRKDPFWGAKPADESTLVGMNVLGRLLMELREAVRSQGRDALQIVQPPAIPEFLLFGRQIEAVAAPDLARQSSTPIARPAGGGALQGQASLFKVPTAREVSPSPYDVEMREPDSVGHLKPYPTMKDSGVPWLGKVPAHWDVQPISRIGALLKGRGGSKEDEESSGIPCVRYGDLYTRHEFFITSSKGFVSVDRARAYTPIRYGDVLFAGSGETIEDIGRSAVNLLEGDAVCGGDVILLRPNRNTNPRFLGYAADAPSSRHQKATMGRGFTVVHIYGSELKRLVLAIPPSDEQAAIVRFLDHADRRIRRGIRSKQKLIKLLEEEKQAIVHRVVTRGLDPNVRLKSAGVEWLGEVPGHWQIRRMGRIAKIFNGTTPSRARPSYWDGGTVPWLSSGKVNQWIVETPSEFVTEQARQDCSLPTAPKGAVIVGLVGQGKTRGKAALLGLDACINQNLAAVVPRGQTSGLYLLYWLTASYKPLRELGRGGNQEALNCEIVGNWRVAFPPQQEQDAICRHLEKARLNLSGLERRIRREVDLLHEFRKRLIADIVTGKLDVREAAARLPDNLEEPEPLDETQFQTDSEETDDTVEGVTEEAEA